jgi:hypothetical protein
LFEELYEKQTLNDGIAYIKEFCRIKGIIASNNIPYGNSKSKKNLDLEDNFTQSYQGSKKKIPQFILDLRKQKNDSSSNVSQVSKSSSSVV